MEHRESPVVLVSAKLVSCTKIWSGQQQKDPKQRLCYFIFYYSLWNNRSFGHQRCESGLPQGLDEPGAADLFKWPATCDAGACSCTTGTRLQSCGALIVAHCRSHRSTGSWSVSVCRCSLQQAHWTVPGNNHTQAQKMNFVGDSCAVADCLHDCICQRHYRTNLYCSPQSVACALERASDARADL